MTDGTVRVHTIEFVKKMAKKIKKREVIPHHEALNLAAQEVGFKNWEDFKNNQNDLSDNRGNK